MEKINNIHKDLNKKYPIPLNEIDLRVHIQIYALEKNTYTNF